MQKELTFGREAREKLIDGVNMLANAVKATLGPKGRTVLIEKAMGAPAITKDGVTVAKDIALSDPVENLGAQIVKQAAAKTVKVAGDGTTTATVLAQALINNGHRMISAGISPAELRAGFNRAQDDFIVFLDDLRERIDDDKDKIRNVATISANNDKEIGDWIAKAFELVGLEGVITVEESKTADTYVETVAGVEYDRGYVSPYLITDYKKSNVVYENPLIFITDKKMKAVKDVIDLLEISNARKKPLHIICDEIEGQALSILILNKVKGGIPVVATRAPGWGDTRKQLLQDLCTVTGAELMSEDKGLTYDDVLADPDRFFGSAGKVIVNRENTVIVDGKGDKAELEQRADIIRALLEQEEGEYQREQLKARLAKLVGGVAVLHVGAHTDVEMNEKKDRIDDALHATAAALKEGIVTGGGKTFINIARTMKGNLEAGTIKDDEVLGYKLVMESLYAPFKTICENAGVDPGMALEKVQDKEFNFGYNAATDTYEDLKKAGVLDPSILLATELENAISVAMMLLSTEVTIHEKEVNYDNGYPDDIDPSRLIV